MSYSKAAVAARFKVNAAYVTAFNALFGAGTLQDADAAYAAMTKSIAAFERTDVFQPFDSKYDRSLRGEAQLTEQEELGRVAPVVDAPHPCNRQRGRPRRIGEQRAHDVRDLKCQGERAQRRAQAEKPGRQHLPCEPGNARCRSEHRKDRGIPRKRRPQRWLRLGWSLRPTHEGSTLGLRR